MSALRIMKFYVGESGVKKPISTIKTLSFFTPLCPNQAFLKKKITLRVITTKNSIQMLTMGKKRYSNLNSFNVT